MAFVTKRHRDKNPLIVLTECVPEPKSNDVVVASPA